MAIKPEVRSRRPLLVGICIVLVLALIFLGVYYFSIMPNTVSDKVKNLYQLGNPGTTVDIVSINDDSGLYRILMKTTSSAGTNYIEAYATKDGKLLTQNVIQIDDAIRQIGVMRNFVTCLKGKGVEIFGLNNQTATLLQLNALGTYSTSLYVSCDGRESQCASAGVQQVPSVVYNNTAYAGVQTAQWFASLTGCSLS